MNKTVTFQPENDLSTENDNWKTWVFRLQKILIRPHEVIRRLYNHNYCVVVSRKKVVVKVNRMEKSYGKAQGLYHDLKT